MHKFAKQVGANQINFKANNNDFLYFNALTVRFRTILWLFSVRKKAPSGAKKLRKHRSVLFQKKHRKSTENNHKIVLKRTVRALKYKKIIIVGFKVNLVGSHLFRKFVHILISDKKVRL